MTGRNGIRRQLFGGVAVALIVGSQAHALTINTFFDPSISGAGNAAQVEATINAATQFYGSFANPATVNIYFTVGDGLGGSTTTLYGDFYNNYVGNLQLDSAANPQNAPLQSGLANIAFSNKKDLILATSANLRALGYSGTDGALGADGVLGHGTFDGVITLNTSIMNFGDDPAPGFYPANPVIQHEIDEILGVGGPGSLVDQPFGPKLSGFTYMGAEDLYRFSGLHTASFTSNPSNPSYFSVNGGATNIIGFNAGPNGDLGDWVTDCSAQHVQDWVGCPGTATFGLTLNSPETTALQAIGYNLSGAVPEPSEWALAIAGLGLMGATLRRRRTATVAA